MKTKTKLMINQITAWWIVQEKKEKTRDKLKSLMSFALEVWQSEAICLFVSFALFASKTWGKLAKNVEVKIKLSRTFLVVHVVKMALLQKLICPFIASKYLKSVYLINN